jgi:uncharacterized membrane protein
MPKINSLKRIFTISGLMLLFAVWVDLIAYFLYRFSHLFDIFIVSVIGILIGYTFLVNLPYKINLRWARYLNKTALSSKEFARLRSRTFGYIIASQAIGIFIRQLRIRVPIWILPLSSGIVVGTVVGYVIFALKNREAILGIKKQGVLSSKAAHQRAYWGGNNYLS